MKKLILVIIYCFTFFSFSQKHDLAKGVPIFYGSNSSGNEIQKAKSLKRKTQVYLAKNLSSDFLKKVLKTVLELNPLS